MAASIGILVNSLLSGGAEKQAVLLARVLHAHHKIVVIVWNGNNVNQNHLDSLIVNRIPHILLEGSLLARLIQYASILNHHGIKILFSYLLTSNLIAGVVGKLLGVPYIFGGIRSSYLPSHKLYVQKILHNHFTYNTIINSYRGYEYLANNGYEPSKLIVINNGIDIPGIDRNSKKSKQIVILSVGRFDIAKDYRTALLALQALKERTENFVYQIVGWGALESDIRSLIRELDLSKQVSIVTDITNAEEYYKNSDIFLSTSIFEGFSNSIIEAMSFSLPVIATDVGDNSRIIVHGKTGYVARVKDAKRIATYLEQLIGSRDLSEKLGAEGLRHVHSCFSTQVFERKYLELINSI